MHHFSQLIDNDKNRVVIIAFQLADNGKPITKSIEKSLHW